MNAPLLNYVFVSDSNYWAQNNTARLSGDKQYGAIIRR
jgi:hypothetical protein